MRVELGIMQVMLRVPAQSAMLELSLEYLLPHVMCVMEANLLPLRQPHAVPVVLVNMQALMLASTVRLAHSLVYLQSPARHVLQAHMPTWRQLCARHVHWARAWEAQARAHVQHVTREHQCTPIAPHA